MAEVKTVEMSTEGDSVIVVVTVPVDASYLASSANVSIKVAGTNNEGETIRQTAGDDHTATFRRDGLEAGTYDVKAVCSDKIFSDRLTVPSTKTDMFTFEENVGSA
jgi:hypothetical protein